MLDLTNLQGKVFEYVRGELLRGRPAPTLRELAAEFGWSSKRAAACHIEAIVRKGWLAAEKGKARSLRLTKAGGTSGRVVEIPLLGSIPAGFSDDRSQTDGECVPVTIESIGFTPTRNTF